MFEIALGGLVAPRLTGEGVAPRPTGKGALVSIFLSKINGRWCIAILQDLIVGGIGLPPFLVVLENSLIVDQVVGFPIMGVLKKSMARGTYKPLSNGGHLHIYKHFSRPSTCTYHIGPRTHHVNHACVALGSALDIFNGATKLVCGHHKS
jgi:hypothetical protein